MSLKIDLNIAQKLLLKALNESKSFNKQIPNEQFLRDIFLGTHKTFKYIAFTAILAKAVESKINILSLQAGADIEGAYDARSLCHKVVVGFERKYLKNALGGSNEPYLNKPARFKMLNISNAVRRGNDQFLLNLLCKELPKINSSKKAFETLTFVLNILQNEVDNTEISLEQGKVANDLNAILTFANSLEKKSFEGQIPVLLVGSILNYYNRVVHLGYKVVVHKVNQSGASSKEISDIDIYEKDSIRICCEIKDKSFYDSDVQHAISKLSTSSSRSLFFIYGRNGILHDSTFQELELKYLKLGYALKFVSVSSFFETILTMSSRFDFSLFVKSLNEVSKQMNPAIDCLSYVKSVLKELEFK